MKKTLAIVLAAMLLVACFAGCAAKPAEESAPVDTEDTAPVDTEDTAPVEGEDAAPAEETGLEGNWVADGHPDYTMVIDSTTMTAADGTVYEYTMDADGVITMTAEGVTTEDVMNVTYDSEKDVITMTAGDATVDYLRAE